VKPEGSVVAGYWLSGALLSSNANSPGTVRVGFAKKDGAISDTGIILRVPFRAVGSPGDRTPINLTITTSNDPAGGTLAIDRIGGEIVIVNPDGSLPGGGAGATGGTGTGGTGTGGTGGSGGELGGLVRGDCDGSGVLTEIDALCALDMSVQLRKPQPLMDLNDDGDVTSRDATLILQQVVAGQ
jgi:hypothetical protein